MDVCGAAAVRMDEKCETSMAHQKCSTAAVRLRDAACFKGCSNAVVSSRMSVPDCVPGCVRLQCQL